MRANSLAALALLSGVAIAPSPAGSATMSGSYFEDTAFASCFNVPGNSCGAAFPTLPSTLTGQMLTVTEINCSILSNGPVAHAQLIVTDDLQNPRRNHNITVPASTGFFTFREAVNFKITGGPPRRIVVTFTGTDGHQLQNFSCMVIGVISAN